MHLLVIHPFQFLAIIHSILSRSRSLSLVTMHRRRWSSSKETLPETFVIARYIPMHLGNTELCPRNTNCSGDLCVIHDRDDSAGGSFVMCCIVSVFPAAILRGIPLGSRLDLPLLNGNRKVQGYVIKRPRHN